MWGLEEEMEDIGFTTMPTGDELCDALFEQDEIEWERFSAFQDVV